MESFGFSIKPFLLCYMIHVKESFVMAIGQVLLLCLIMSIITIYFVLNIPL